MYENQVRWAIATLHEKNYQLLSQTPDVIQENPWAIVYRFQSNQGFVYLKCVPSELSIEPTIIKILLSEFNANVPVIIAENSSLFCFLMKDAGIQMHQYFKQNFQSDILIKTMREYTNLQITATHKIDRFLELGIPDWRLEKLPALYDKIIAEKKLLLDDGLSKNEVEKLRKLAPTLSSLCSQLAQYNIKDTFGHADFHDKNICINPDTGKTTIIDLGEVVITYPFFSFLNCLFRAKENFSLTDEQYHQLQMDCFVPWLEFESQENLLGILRIINQCWPIHSVLGEYRLMKSVNQVDYQKLLRQGRFANNFRYWLLNPL